MPIALPVTLLYGGSLGLWFLVLSFRVVSGRTVPGGPSLGDGGDPAMLRRIRAHANFAEYVPLVLVLLAGLELSGLPRLLLHTVGGMLLAGRLLHGFALAYTEKFAFGRMAGMILTFGALLIASLAALYRAAYGG